MKNSYSKNKSVRTGLVLVLLSIITMVAMTATFAKYVSSGNFSDDARVAKWGIGFESSTEALFKTEYMGKAPYDSSATVKSSDQSNVIAPGISNEARIIVTNVTGKAPEVSYKFDVNAKNVGSAETMARLDKTKALHWYLHTPVMADDEWSQAYNTFAEFQAAVKAMSRSWVEPNKLPDSISKNGAPAPSEDTTQYVIKAKWVWDFHNSDAQDVLDTDLGNDSAAGKLDPINLVFTFGAQQINDGQPGPTPEKATFSGTVEEKTSHATISGATVKFNGAQQTTVDDGRFSFNVDKGTASTLEVSANGYNTYSQAFIINDDKDIIVELEKQIVEYTVDAFVKEGQAEYGSVIKSDGFPAKLPAGTSITSYGTNVITLITPNGDEHTITAQANSGYKFLDWSPTPFGSLDSNKTYIASFVEKDDPGIEVPYGPQSVEVDSSIALDVTKASDAPWNDPSSSDLSVATAKWENGKLIVNGLKEGDATITVSVPEASDYKAGSKLITVKVTTSEKQQAKQKVDASSDEIDASIDSIDSKNLFDEYKAELHADVQKAKDTAYKEIDEAKTILVNSSAIDAALAKFAAAIKAIEKEIPNYIGKTKSEKDASIEDASSIVNKDLEIVKSTKALYQKSKNGFKLTFEGCFLSIQKKIQDSQSKYDLNYEFLGFKASIQSAERELTDFIKEEQAQKDQHDASVKQIYKDASEAIDSIENLTALTKARYVNSVDKEANISIDNINNKAGDDEEAQVIVANFEEIANNFVQEAKDQASRPWDINWDPTTKVEVKPDASVSLDASAYVTDQYAAQAPKPAYTLDKDVDPSFSIGVDSKGVPFIAVAAGVPEGDYNISALVTFAAVKDYGAKTLKEAKITVSVKQSKPDTFTVSAKLDQENHGSIDPITIENVPYGTTYEVDNVNTQIKIGTGPDTRIIKYKNLNIWILDKWMLDGSEAPKEGMVTENLTFVAKTKLQHGCKSLTQDGFKYFPVFNEDKGIDKVDFYDKDGNKILVCDMASVKNAEYYSSEEGVSFLAVRSINLISYSEIYGIDSSPGAKEVLKKWADENLKEGEVVEKLSTDDVPSGIALVHSTSLASIWKAYNETGFGLESGQFWSCVAKDNDIAYYYDCSSSLSNEWPTQGRSVSYYVSACVSRYLTIDGEATINIKLDQENHGSIDPSTIENVPYGTVYEVDNFNNKITIGSGEASHTIQYTNNEHWALDKWFLKDVEAPARGIVTGDMTFTAQTAFIQSLTKDGCKYLPVFDGENGIANVKFYDKDYKLLDIKTMADVKSNGAEFCSINKNTSFTAVRSINNLSYNDVYEQGDTGAKDPLPEWIDGKLKRGEKLEKLTENEPSTGSSEPTPKIAETNLSNIWQAYNNGKTDGFGAANGWFWSCFAKDLDHAYYWSSKNSTWNEETRNSWSNLCVCVSRVFNGSDQAIISAKIDYPDHGTIDKTIIENVPLGSTYEVDNTNKKITIKIKENPQIIQYSNSDKWAFDKWMIGNSEAPESGVIQGDISFTAKTRQIYSLTQDGIKYFPVFSGDSGISGIIFYDSNKKEIAATNMESIKNAEYYSASKNKSFTAVRSINDIAYDDVYGVDTISGQHDVLDSWADANLKLGETIEPLTTEFSPKEEPKIGLHSASITSIWKAYNNEKDIHKFGGANGVFWSCVAADALNAYIWSGQNTHWNYTSRIYGDSTCFCVSRVFAGEGEAKVSAVLDNEGHGSIDVSTIENVPFGTSYVVDHASKKIIVGTGTEAKEIKYTNGNNWVFDKWMQGQLKCMSKGIILGNTTFTAKTLELKSLTQDGVKYWPVFNGSSGITGVKFYDANADVMTVTDMKSVASAQYYSVEHGASFTAVRCIDAISYDTVYGEGSSGPKDVDEQWASQNLKNGETVEQLSTEFYPKRGEEPHIASVGLNNIWKAYNESGYWDNKGFFWACVSDEWGYALYWDCAAKEWYYHERWWDEDVSICISRVFTGDGEATINVNVDEPNHGYVDKKTIEKIPFGSTYIVDNKEKRITILNGGLSQVINYVADDKWTLDKWMIGYNEAPKIGTIAGNTTFTAKTKPQGKFKSLTVDNVRYWPVFSGSNGIANVEFYDKDINKLEVTDMASAKNAQYYSTTNNASFTVARSINDISYDEIYGKDSSAGVNQVDPSWASKNLKEREIVENLSQSLDPTQDPEPQINSVKLSSIWKAYNNDQISSGFGGTNGNFWSCVAKSNSSSYFWGSKLGKWDEAERTVKPNNCVCASRVFPLDGTATINAKLDKDTHGSISKSIIKNVPFGTVYTVDNVNKNITIGSGMDAQIIQYTYNEQWTLDKWMVGSNPAPAKGVIKGDITFTAKTKSFNSLTRDGVKYFPVFAGDTGIANVQFYDKNRTEIIATDMESVKDAEYYSLVDGASFTAVRSIKTSYSKVYDKKGPGPHEPIQTWKDAYLKSGENVEILTNIMDPVFEPKIASVGLNSIWHAYKSVGFSDENGNFWSCVALTKDLSYFWHSKPDPQSEWVVEDSSQEMSLCISREFAETTVHAKVDDTEHGSIDKGIIENVPIGSSYVIDMENNTITIDIKDRTEVISYIQNDRWVLDKWMIGDTEAPIKGYITKDISFTAKTKIIKYIKPLTQDGYKYLPVFNGDSGIEGVQFYDASVREIKVDDMASAKNAEYYKAENGISFVAVRSINGVSFNEIYGTKGTSGAQEVDASWASANIKDTEFVEALSESEDPTKDPSVKIASVELSSIWKAYNSEQSSTSFGGLYGSFWTCVAKNENDAYYWASDSDSWDDSLRSDQPSKCLCVSRFFAGEGEATIKTELDHEGHGSISETTLENIPIGTIYKIDNANGKITFVTGLSTKVVQYTNNDQWGLQKWMLDDKEAPSRGVVVRDMTFTAKTTSIKSLTKDECKYWPVFSGSKGLEGVRFYDKDHNECKVKTMADVKSKKAEYFSALDNVIFSAVRSINEVSYNEIYGNDSKSGAKEVDAVWAANNLKTGENVEMLTKDIEPFGEPKIGLHSIGINSVWESYKNEDSSFDFGGKYGKFLSCVAYDSDAAISWWSGAGHGWTRNDRSDAENLCVCISRPFAGDGVVTISADVDKDGHGTLDKSKIDNVPIGSSYFVDNVNQRITINIGQSVNVIQYTDYKKWTFDKWMIGDNEAPVKGIIAENMKFTAKTKPKEPYKSLYVDGYKYLPVFSGDNGIENVDFYDKDINKIEVSDMASVKDAEYFTVSNKAGFIAVRSINGIPYNNIYGEYSPAGVNKVDPSWAASSLKERESVEILSKSLNPTQDPEPQINNTNLSSIWKAYNNNQSATSFGGVNGMFWSCVANVEGHGYYWGCKNNNWGEDTRVTGLNMSVCISRVFPVEAKATIHASLDSEGHGEINSALIENVPFGSTYTVDNTNKKIIINDGSSSTVIQYTKNDSWTLDKWLLGEDEAPLQGVVTGDLNFIAKTIAIKSFTQDDYK